MVRYPAKHVANAFAASAAIKASAGYLVSLSCFNTNAATRYLMVFDSATVPADGTVPMLPPVAIPTKSTGSIDYNSSERKDLKVVQGYPFMSGIAVALSTTDTTLTVTTTADGMFTALYR